MSLSFISYYQAMIMCLLCVIPLFVGIPLAVANPLVGRLMSLVGLIGIIISIVRISQGNKTEEKKE